MFTYFYRQGGTMSRINFGLPSNKSYTIVKHPKKERVN